SLFYYLLDYKTFWRKKGYNTPIVNFLICRQVQQLFGGRMQYVVTGSAPLSPDTHEFIRSCLNVILIQGYGLTETAAGATLMDFEDLSSGRVGPPLYGLKIKLQDWPEGNYSVNDKPNPRGELVIGGDCVTAGYYKNEKQTNESYKDVDGERWFWTGDIAEVHADGVIKIIDRKKDLNIFRSEKWKLTSCVYADSKQAYVVALINANPKALSELGKQLGKGNLSFEQLCDDPQVNEAVLKVIKAHAAKVKLHKSEIPNKITLVKEVWTPESGLVTAALKLKRRNIEEKYKSEIERMYANEKSK
ncbi:long chain fatty acid CoA ligase-like protein, partial [Leptotrombidium deliense]